MGMTDKQFNGFLRLIIKELKEIEKSMVNNENKVAEEKIKEVIENLRQTMED